MPSTEQMTEVGYMERPINEEIMNAGTHGLGFLLSVLATTAVFSAPAPSTGTAIACGVYVTTLVIVYLVSTLSHAVQDPSRKHTLRALDQGVIYLLIAGTYTPLMWAYMVPQLRWLGLAAVWTAAIMGKYSKVIAQLRVTDFSAQTYLWLGWLPSLFLVGRVPLACLGWMALGGVSYTAGTIFLICDRRCACYHAIWHLFVIGGSACHFYAIYKFVLLSA